jgi:hypothetical protein
MAAALASSSFGTPDERIILANRLVSFASSLTGLAYAMIGMRDKALSVRTFLMSFGVEIFWLMAGCPVNVLYPSLLMRR